MSLKEAMNENNLLCYQMTGTRCEENTASPVRLIAPGWCGVANVKWLTNIRPGRKQAQRTHAHTRLSGGEAAQVHDPAQQRRPWADVPIHVSSPTDLPELQQVYPHVIAQCEAHGVQATGEWVSTSASCTP